MKYAVIRTGGKQYKIAEGDVITVEHIVTEDKNITFSDVLLYASESQVEVGAPLLTHITVSGTVLGDVKGDKIRVSKFKAKARYRRVNGHRQSLSQIKIESIGASKKESKEAKETEGTKVVKQTASKEA